MISLKRNSKGEFVEATGLRTRASSIYVPNQPKPFRISRSKFNDFLMCQRCFYLDRVKGIISPSLPGWTLNETTDILLKKEFDFCRERQIPHRIFGKYNLDDLVPFQHEDLSKWRDSLHHGLESNFEGSNIILHGGVDDIWFDKINEELIVVDYKSQASVKPVSANTYLRSTYHQSYTRQLDFYAYLLIQMGFEVSSIGYFYVCNADRSADAFNGKITFDEVLVPYEWDIGWIEPKLEKMVAVLNSDIIPERTDSCENCAYSYQRMILDS